MYCKVFLLLYWCRVSSRQRQNSGNDHITHLLVQHEWRNQVVCAKLHVHEKCQQRNTKFVKSTSNSCLAKVWHQVSCYFDCCMYLCLYIRKCVDFIYLYMQVGIDMIGQLPLTKKGTGILDYFSKWPGAVLLPDKTAAGVALFLYELFCRCMVSNICTWSC